MLYIPAKARVIETELQGVILDLSSDGCKLAMNVAENAVSRFFKTEDEIMISFPVLGKEDLETVQGIVKHIIEDDEKRIFGIQFDDLSEKIALKIDNYIEDVKKFT